MQVLGIDPGTRLVGYGLIHFHQGQCKCVTYGRIRLPEKDLLSERLRVLRVELKKLLESMQPDFVGVESLFVHKNAMSSLKLAHARGVILSLIAERGLELREYAPRLIKQAVVGKGQATKQQVQFMVKSLLQLDAVPKPDAADALAIAICCAHHVRWGFLENIS
ncbi:MAG TPA: crossover junction endodeoxyribonuclease RuvC [Gammaproteobacteria bacterium]|nr:crossover junction endodeoxyribonuclease RuvC [Gammaproteobacteria bacterium]